MEEIYRKGKTGPGDYSPERNMHSSMKQFPRYGMGSSTREGFNILTNGPGPGHYSQRQLLGNDCLKKTISSVPALDIHANEQKFKPGPG